MTTETMKTESIPLFEPDTHGHVMFVICMSIAGRMTHEQFMEHWDMWSDETRLDFNKTAAEFIG